MRALLAAALLLIAASARAADRAISRGSAASTRCWDAASPAQVERGVRIKVTGTVVPEDIFRIVAPIEGRVESVKTSTYVWRGADQPLAFLAERELAAMIDSHGSQNMDVLEDRWHNVYRQTPVLCPDACFVLKSLLKAKSWVKPRDVLFEAARKLKLVARVRSEDAPWIRDGQDLVFWSVTDPLTRRRSRVKDFALDIRSDQASPGGSFFFYMSPDLDFQPGTKWEGKVSLMSKKDVLFVPTGALIRHGGAVYLPIRVSTGITTQSLTQITDGAEENQEILVLDDSQLNGAERHKQTAAPEGSGQVPAPRSQPGKHAEILDDADRGENPYDKP